MLPVGVESVELFWKNVVYLPFVIYPPFIVNCWILSIWFSWTFCDFRTLLKAFYFWRACFNCTFELSVLFIFKPRDNWSLFFCFCSSTLNFNESIGNGANIIPIFWIEWAFGIQEESALLLKELHGSPIFLIWFRLYFSIALFYYWFIFYSLSCFSSLKTFFSFLIS